MNLSSAFLFRVKHTALGSAMQLATKCYSGDSPYKKAETKKRDTGSAGANVLYRLRKEQEQRQTVRVQCENYLMY